EDVERLRMLGALGVALGDVDALDAKDNYKELLKPLLTEGEGQGFCVNLSVDTSSLDIIKLCRKLDVPYIDTVVEPWLG
ncbi:saccharopine dehydrogenase NADP-binding domain-containing protein, partial [Rhizobium ruizarguesonis]